MQAPYFPDLRGVYRSEQGNAYGTRSMKRIYQLIGSWVYDCNFELIVSKHMSVIYILSISCEIEQVNGC